MLWKVFSTDFHRGTKGSSLIFWKRYTLRVKTRKCEFKDIILKIWSILSFHKKKIGSVLYISPLQVFFSKATYQINSVLVLNPSREYHSENYKQGFQFDKLVNFMQSNLNTSFDGNPLVPLLNSVVENHRKLTPAKFGSMILDPGKFNLSPAALESFGKKFEPEILKFFNKCGSLVQTQRRWWRSGLVFGKLSESLVQFSKSLQNSCP